VLFGEVSRDCSVYSVDLFEIVEGFFTYCDPVALSGQVYRGGRYSRTTEVSTTIWAKYWYAEIRGSTIISATFISINEQLHLLESSRWITGTIK
jgi:hypothetical protein